MTETTDLKEVLESTGRDPLVLVEVGSRTCTPCLAIRDKIDLYLASHEDTKGWYLSIEDCPEAAQAFGVLSAPTVLLYVSGKLTLRKSGYFSLEEILSAADRYRDFLKG